MFTKTKIKLESKAFVWETSYQVNSLFQLTVKL